MTPRLMATPYADRLLGGGSLGVADGKEHREKRKQTSDDGPVAVDRQRLGRGFDSAADLYQQARSEYPEPLYDTLVEVAGVRVGDRLLEVGCATGKATLPLARCGFGITCVEIGPNLAAVARSNLAAFPFVEVMSGAFETWQPPSSDRFDLVFAATAWHWIDPALRYQRAWELLRPAGHLAFWTATHVIPEGGDLFFAEIQDVYEEIGEGMPAGIPVLRPGGIPDDSAEIEGSGLFEDVVVRYFDLEISYSAEEYLRVLDTFSGHIAMQQPWQRSASTRRSGGASHSGRTVDCVVTGERSYTSPAEPIQHPPHKGSLDRDTTVAAPGSVCRPVQREGEEIAVRVRGVVAERRAGDESVAHV